MELTHAERMLTVQALREVAAIWDRKSRSRGLTGPKFAGLRRQLRSKRDEARELAEKLE